MYVCVTTHVHMKVGGYARVYSHIHASTVGSIKLLVSFAKKLLVSFAKEPYKRHNILFSPPTLSLLLVCACERLCRCMCACMYVSML